MRRETTSAVVLGGGIAGLAAALELSRRGVRVTLLEASTRFGGRIRTVLHGRLPVELGAEFVHGKSKPLLAAIKAARLAARTVSGTSHLAQGGSLTRIDFWEEVDGIIGRIPARGPDCSFAAFLTAERIPSQKREWARDFVEGFNAADAARISAHSLLQAQRSAEGMEGDWQGRVRQGYGALVEFLEMQARAAGARLVRRANVREVRWGYGRVEVTWGSGRRAGVCRAGKAVITLPLGVWQARSAAFHPALREKQAAAKELLLGDVCKLSLVFRQRWWPQTGSGFIHAPGEPLPTWWGDPRGPLLTGWAGGPRAKPLLALPRAKLVRVCLETLARIFSETPARLRERLDHAYHYNWSADPAFGGAYSYLPVNGLDLPKVLAAPESETLFFAGEATALDAQMGTVFGAYESGLRAARELLRR